MLSGVTKGDVIAFGHGSGDKYKYINNVTVQYYVSDKQYTEVFLKSDVPDTATSTPICYLLFAPSFSRLDTEVGNWGLVLVLFVLFFSCLTIVFLIKDIIPNGSYFQINRRYPYIKLIKENNLK